MFDQILSLLWPDLRSQAATNPQVPPVHIALWAQQLAEIYRFFSR
jgi:hypothetical protein